MTIQWYPGHMHKAQREIKQSLPKVDVVIEVVDARIPFSSENPLLGHLRGDKPCIKVLHKSDLADMDCVRCWQRTLEKERRVKTLSLSTENVAKIKKIADLCKKLVPAKAQAGKKVRAMIVGIPNVGKSTLINILAGKAIARTGNEPAVTKSQQFVPISETLLLLDTPGVLWPKQEYERSSYRLAATGAIKDTALDYADVGFFAAGFLLQHYPGLLRARYSLDALPVSELEFLEVIGRQRGCLGSGGRVDLTRISELFIHDFRNGRMGRVCMETPAMIAEEMAEHRQKNGK